MSGFTLIGPFAAIGVKSRPIAPPSQGRSISLITRVNPFPGWGHAWTRKMTPSIPIFRNEINALGNFREGVNIASELTCRHLSGLFDPDGICDTVPKHLTLFSSLDFAMPRLDNRFAIKLPSPSQT